LNLDSDNPAEKLSKLRDLFEVIPLPSRLSSVHLAMALPSSTSECGEELLPSAAMPEAGRIASGRGLTRDQAEASCLGEAAELASACFWGDEPLLRASFREVGDAAIHPAALLLASDDQYDQRTAWNASFGAFDWMPERLDEATEIEWVEVTSPDGVDRALIPAANAYIGYFEPGDTGAFAVADSNGCAAGGTLEEATVAAFLEIVERDATALWWYGGHARPAVDVSRVAGAEALLASLAGRRREFHVLDLTTDLGIPVCAAISYEPGGRIVAIGVTADFDADRAILSALTEMAQIEFSLQMRAALPVDRTDGSQFWLDNVSLQTAPHLLPVGQQPPGHGVQAGPATVRNCLRICGAAGLRFFSLDLTRQTINVPVVRAIVLGMRPSRCRLAKGRLFDIPTKLGWRPIVQAHQRTLIPLSI
jgi:thiazole/oxazole-forming peptide maturase SagD family component